MAVKVERNRMKASVKYK